MTTTTNLRPAAPPRARFDGLPLPLAIALVVFALLGIAAAAGRIASAPAVAVQPTPPLPIIIVATAQPVAVPLVAPAPVQVAAQLPANITRRAIVVYGAADTSTAIGAVEPGRRFTPVAHFGADWMVVDMDGSGRVYVRVADLYDLPGGLVDLKPPQVVVQPVYVNQPQQEIPIAPLVAPQAQPPAYQVDNQPPAQAAQPAPTAAPQPTAAPAQAAPHDGPVEAEWARQQWAAEHCIAGKCIP